MAPRLPEGRPLGPTALNRWNLPDLGVGIGLRTTHFGQILSQHPSVDWFEVLSENFMRTGGRPLWRGASSS